MFFCWYHLRGTKMPLKITIPWALQRPNLWNWYNCKFCLADSWLFFFFFLAVSWNFISNSTISVLSFCSFSQRSLSTGPNTIKWIYQQSLISANSTLTDRADVVAAPSSSTLHSWNKNFTLFWAEGKICLPLWLKFDRSMTIHQHFLVVPWLNI